MQRALSLLGASLREAGQSLDTVGARLQGNNYVKEELCRHRRLLGLGNKLPSVGQGAFIAPNASVIGNVSLGAKSSVWYGAVLRGDVNNINVGSGTSIGERTVIHVTSTWPKGGKQTTIGNNVVIESSAILHGCVLEDGSKVESGAIVFDGAVVGKNSVVGSGSVVSSGKQIPAGEFWSGSPAKFVRKLSEDEIKKNQEDAAFVQSLALLHDKEHSKSTEQLEQEAFERRYTSVADHIEQQIPTK